MEHDLRLNKDNAIAFYRAAYSGDPAAAIEKYVGPEYIQHNPLVGDGKQPFIDYFDAMANAIPSTTPVSVTDWRRCIQRYPIPYRTPL